MTKVLVCGACGKMGLEVVRAVMKDQDLELVGVVDRSHVGEDIGTLAGLGACKVQVASDLTQAIEQSQPDVMVDFTNPQSVFANVGVALSQKVRPVVGTTGLKPDQVEQIRNLCEKHKTSALISPNFAIGAVLMMQLSVQAAKYLSHVEIIELHHDQKLDAPSGTALRTAELISEVRKTMQQGHPNEEEKLAGSRGGQVDGMHIHSVRLPGYVAHQEVIFGGTGQTLTIRHDSISRESFMPGVVLACKKIMQQKGLIVGLENLLD